MEKYKIQIIKESENKDPMDKMCLNNHWDDVIFDARMKADDAIEILRHLFDLKERRNDAGACKNIN